MLNLVQAIRLLREKTPPTSNDPHMQLRFNQMIWEERNGATVGRCIMAWLAIAGWLAFAVAIAI